MALTRPRAEQIYNLDYKQATRVVTIVNITLTGGAPNNVDGVNLSIGNRVLVTGQANPAQNGLYDVYTVGTGSNGTWIRTSDANATGEIEAGMIIMVTEGQIYADTQWKLITDNPIDIGVTGLTFTQNYLANSISSGSSNVVVSANANVTISSSGVANVLTVSPTGVYVSGVTSVTGNIYAGNISVSGNIIGNVSFDQSISVSGNIQANYYLGNGYYLTDIQAGNIIGGYGNANVVSFLESGNAVSISTTGNISTSGNIATGNASAAGNMYAANFITANTIVNNGVSTTGNVIANYIQANAGLLTGTLSLSGNIQGGNVSTAGNVSAGNILTAGQISATGNVTGNNFLMYGSGNILGNLNVQGNITFIDSNVIVTNDLYIDLANNQSTYANINGAGFNVGNTGSAPLVTWTYQTAANAWTTNVSISATANVTAAYFIGNGSQLTGITANSIVGSYSNANVIALGEAGWAGNIVPSADSVYSLGNSTRAWKELWLSGNSLQIGGGVLSVNGANLLFNGNVLVQQQGNTGNIAVGNISVSGNAVAGYFVGDGSYLTNITANAIVGAYSNANVAAYLPTYTGNISAGNISVAGNIAGNSILTSGTISSYGNITTDGYFIGTFIGNISGNVTVPGLNTQVIYNNQGNAGASAGLTFDKTSNTLTVSSIVSVGGNVLSNNVVVSGQVDWVSGGTSAVYQIYNSSTGSLDTIFG